MAVASSPNGGGFTKVPKVAAKCLRRSTLKVINRWRLPLAKDHQSVTVRFFCTKKRDPTTTKQEQQPGPIRRSPITRAFPGMGDLKNSSSWTFEPINNTLRITYLSVHLSYPS
ncbi:hypothetical protein Droror1_Dr00015970 [Drosera rotundifolia]